MCDSSSALCLAHNPVFHKRAKHIKVRHHFLRDHVEKGDIEMKFIDTERQLADIFTKPLDSSRFAFLRGELGVCHLYGLV
jgi:hypothetical protein